MDHPISLLAHSTPDPEDIRQAATRIEWRKTRHWCNILIHQYLGVYLPIIWDIVETKLDALDEACRKLLAK